ncbi:probable histone-lysine N-methyltransferase Mes-4 isoform X2 [Contarinia nasturtii]|uniref:probable histone-lysine N-methyltransferase Mes-4 isoform X2 n=1 Tax=Contarinia nasturtii TaxID=265458 RepID=UPI0012D39E26|nr:probable histone-lysine N-methyltransferase Mes-4 isoform X2 [Contarinia nasturtii]
MSENNKTTRKRPASPLIEYNNNNDEVTREKRRRIMESRLKSQLESNFTDKMIVPLTSPDGTRSRYGRKISPVEVQNNEQRKSMTTQSSGQSKRKVRKVFSIHNTSSELLRFVSDYQTSTQQIEMDNNSNSNTDIIFDLCSENSATSNSIPTMDENIQNIRFETVIKSEYKIPNDSLVSLEMEIDVEDFLTTTTVIREKYVSHQSTDSNEILDQVDLTSSTEGSVGGDDDKSTLPDENVNPPDNDETDILKIHEIVHGSNQISDYGILTSGSDEVSTNEKTFSECTSDDCVMAEFCDSDSLENYHYGQIVWAALPAFWPAVISNCEHEEIFKKDNLIHVKFMYDNARYSWVNKRNALLPFKGSEELIEKCKMTANKRNKAYKITSGKRWNVAVHEANVLQCVKLRYRIDFYDKILMKSVHEMETDIRRASRRKTDRCDTPQTIDTAYSSMKQSVSPASLSPTLNDLDRNYDVDKNINNYLKSVELSRLEELPEDYQMDEAASFATLNESPISSEPIYCPLIKLVYDKLQEDDTFANQNQSIIANESKFTTCLNELWSELSKTKTNRESSLKRSSRRFSISSGESNSTTSTPKQTKRQKELAYKKEKIEQHQMVVEKSAEHQKLKQIQTKEQRKIEKQKQQYETIMNCCLKNHPSNLLLKGLPKDPVCQYCLGSGTVMRCAGKCTGYFHKDCFNKQISESEYNAILKRKMKDTIKAMKNGDELNDDVICIIVENIDKDKCKSCITTDVNVNICFVCSKSDEKCVQCCEKNCGKAYHIECLKYWQQHKIQYEGNKIKSFYCPRHVCHTCISPDIKSMCHGKESDKRLIKCMLCPGTYHRSECIPAGSELLSETQLICARHQSTKNQKRINIDFCILCSKGGSLICCDGCANAFHQECLIIPVGDHFICEECESGRRPLYGEIVWCKYVNSQWWPAVTVPPQMIPQPVFRDKKEPNQICIYFFATHNYGWVSQGQIYLYQKGDGDIKSKKDKELLKDAMDEAEIWFHRFQEISDKSGKSIKAGKPPPYRKIKANRVVAKFKGIEYNECKCRPDDPAPCSQESNCLNAITNIECDPELCPAKEKCQNQNFHKGEQYPFEIRKTECKGWGLFAKEEIPAEKFVIEYMGEVIDSVEFDQRFNRANANKDDNYYFLTLGQNLYIDAAVYGNEARFINHSCDPNVMHMKWSVYSNRQEQLRTGFFALRNILPGEEITFDYNWRTTRKTIKKAVCQCGSSKCNGYI